MIQKAGTPVPVKATKPAFDASFLTRFAATAAGDPAGEGNEKISRRAVFLPVDVKIAPKFGTL